MLKLNLRSPSSILEAEEMKMENEKFQQVLKVTQIIII